MTLFFGGWNAPFPFPFLVRPEPARPRLLGIGLLIAFLVIPPLLTLFFAAPLWLASNRIKGWQALLGGFVLANLFLMAVIGAIAFIGIEWVAGLLWFMGKTYVFVFPLRLDARHAAPRARRPADGLRLEVAPARRPAEPVRDGGRDRDRQLMEAIA